MALYREVAASADDAYEYAGGTGFNRTSNALDAGSHTTQEARGNVGLRFTNITIPQGATIDAAYIEIKPAGGADDANVDIYYQDVLDPVDFETDEDVTSRAEGGTPIPWVEDDLGAAYVASPSLKDLIQEAVDRGSWSSGNALVLLIKGKGDVTKFFFISSKDYTYPAKLHITVAPDYERSVGGTQPAATGALSTKLNAERTLAGAQPAASGQLTAIRPGKLVDSNAFFLANYQAANHFLLTSDGKLAVFYIGTSPDGVCYRTSDDWGDTWSDRVTVKAPVSSVDQMLMAGVQVGDTYYGVACDYNYDDEKETPFKVVYNPGTEIFTLTVGSTIAAKGVPRPQVVWDSVNSYFHMADEGDWHTPSAARLVAYNTSLVKQYDWDSPVEETGTCQCLIDGATIYLCTHRTGGGGFEFRVITAGASSYSPGSPETGLPATCPIADFAYVLLWSKDGKIELIYNDQVYNKVQYITRNGASDWTSPADIDTEDLIPSCGSYYDKTGIPLRTVVYGVRLTEGVKTNRAYRRTPTGWATDDVTYEFPSTMSRVVAVPTPNVIHALYISDNDPTKLYYKWLHPWGVSDLVGVQPAATGVLTRAVTFKRTLAGTQPAATGTLAGQQVRTLAGVQPAPTGVLAAEFVVATPTSFDASNPTQNTIDLAWTRGAGATHTLIRRKVGSYPADKNDGDEAYFDTGESHQDTGLDPETDYYYRAWGARQL